MECTKVWIVLDILSRKTARVLSYVFPENTEVNSSWSILAVFSRIPCIGSNKLYYGFGLYHEEQLATLEKSEEILQFELEGMHVCRHS